MNKQDLLSLINNPADLKKFKYKDLTVICDNLRNKIIEEVSLNPGHFGSSLGVVELTVALHYVFNTPKDKIVWDVGHQAYGHKILTERKDLFHTNRQYKGISGFPKMSESQYDSFGVGHSSTSISAALGMAVASRHINDFETQHIAVIGDGSMSGGMAFEALNHAGVEKDTNLLIILNDNRISIDPSVGAINEYLTDITTSRTYNKLKEDIWNILGKVDHFAPSTRPIIQKIENGVKSILLKQSNLFEALNFRYFGPVDGHDVVRLVRLLKDLKKIKGPKILHLLTVKGKGFEQAEKNQTVWHAPGLFNKDSGELLKKDCTKSGPPLYQDVFGHSIVELAQKNEKIVGITPAMPSGCSLNIMMKKMPSRAFDVGIAEQHAVTFSAGLAANGLIPFCNIYSTFLQRAYDQIVHDVCLQKLNVVLCIDRGGLVGADGPTHHGAFDLAYLRSIPDIIISAPLNEKELRNLMFTSQNKERGPFAIRYPRGKGTTTKWRRPFEEIEIGKGQLINEGNDIAILSIGTVGNYVIEAIEKLLDDNITVQHYDMRFLKPIDTEILHFVFRNYSNVITVEDGTIKGGLGTEVIEFMIDNNYNSTVKRLGIPDEFIEHGDQKQLHKLCGYDPEGIISCVKELVTIKSINTAI